MDSSSLRGVSEGGGDFLRCDFDAKNSFLADDRLWAHRDAKTGNDAGAGSFVTGATPPEAASSYSRLYQDWNGVRVPQPPDFSLMNHEPKPLKRNSREANRVEKYNNNNNNNDSLALSSLEARRQRRRAASHPLPARPQLPSLLAAEKKKEAGFVVSPKMLRPQEARTLFVKEGQFSKGWNSSHGGLREKF